MIVLIRAALLYLLIIFCLRLMGKRQLGELQPSELVITILISNIASLPIEDNSIPMIMGVIPIIVLVSFELITSSISLKSIRFRRLVSGKPVVVIRDGCLDQKAMKELRFSIDDLMESLRGGGVFRIEDVQYAVVETTGKVNILQKFGSQTLTADMIGLNGSSGNPPVTLISDGKIIVSAMEAAQLERRWLDHILKKEGLLPQEIFLMTADEQKSYCIIPKCSVRKGAGK